MAERIIKTSTRKNKGLKAWIDGVLSPLSRILVSAKIHPNLVTFAGLLVTLMVPVETLRGNGVRAGLWLLAAGFFDILDGSLARNAGLEGPFGAFWDSILDRVSEAFVFGGFLLYYGRSQDLSNLLLAFCVCILSLLVSYTRARAEGLGISCEVGILPRPGRVILLALGLMAGRLSLALWIVGVLSLVTVVQRVHRVWSEAKG